MNALRVLFRGRRRVNVSSERGRNVVWFWYFYSVSEQHGRLKSKRRAKLDSNGFSRPRCFNPNSFSKTFIFQRECWKEPFYTVIISNPRIWRIRSGPLRESLTLFRFSKNTRRRRQYDDRIQIFSKTRFNRNPGFGLNKFLAHKGTRYRLSIQNTSYAPHAFLEFIRTIFIFNNVVSHVCDYKYYCSSFQS